MTTHRKIFIVLTNGKHDTNRHYHDTIKTKRAVDEFGRFLHEPEARALERYSPLAVWGSIPGDGDKGNIKTWDAMEPGDYVIVYQNKKIILAAEIALKVRNADLARYFWQETGGKTWELIYFMINDVAFDLEMAKLNRYLEYKLDFTPRGLYKVKQDKADRLLSEYGDLISCLQRLSSGQELEQIPLETRKVIDDELDEFIDKAPTEHTEMQWRLIKLGMRAKYDVWVPSADQPKAFAGHKFRDFVMKEFQESIDVPSYVRNIDTVWKLGYSIKSAFEIEHTTSIYSGILRLSDLRTLTPNSVYPLFIVADESKKVRVFEQLRRPTFSSHHIALNRVVKFLSYDKIRELDNLVSETAPVDWLMREAQAPPS